MTTTRRRFLRSGWKLGGTILTAAAGWTTYESLRPLVGSATGATVDLGSASNYAAETATYVSGARLFVANTGSYLYAISQKCPHLGCHVPYCETSGRFECPCHGSIYDLASLTKVVATTTAAGRASVSVIRPALSGSVPLLASSGSWNIVRSL